MELDGIADWRINNNSTAGMTTAIALRLVSIISYQINRRSRQHNDPVFVTQRTRRKSKNYSKHTITDLFGLKAYMSTANITVENLSEILDVDASDLTYLNGLREKDIVKKVKWTVSKQS